MDVLYKYVTSKIALTCIPEVGDGTLRATQPASLNDPFECAVRAMYVIPDETEENLELAKVLTEINKSKLITPDDVHRARREYGSLRGGLVCLNSAARFDKWNHAAVR